MTSTLRPLALHVISTAPPHRLQATNSCAALCSLSEAQFASTLETRATHQPRRIRAKQARNPKCLPLCQEPLPRFPWVKEGERFGDDSQDPLRCHLFARSPRPRSVKTRSASCLARSPVGALASRLAHRA